jgi:hypothetical protein
MLLTTTTEPPGRRADPARPHGRHRAPPEGQLSALDAPDRAWILIVAVVGSASCQPTGQQGGARNTTMCQAVQEVLTGAAPTLKEQPAAASETVYRLVLIAEKVC